MGIFGEDPRDLFIASQKEEIQYLRGKVDELQKELRQNQTMQQVVTRCRCAMPRRRGRT